MLLSVTKFLGFLYLLLYFTWSYTFEIKRIYQMNHNFRTARFCDIVFKLGSYKGTLDTFKDRRSATSRFSECKYSDQNCDAALTYDFYTVTECRVAKTRCTIAVAKSPITNVKSSLYAVALTRLSLTIYRQLLLHWKASYFQRNLFKKFFFPLYLLTY